MNREMVNGNEETHRQPNKESYEIGPDKIATMEKLLNLLQVMLSVSFIHVNKWLHSLYIGHGTVKAI